MLTNQSPSTFLSKVLVLEQKFDRSRSLNVFKFLFLVSEQKFKLNYFDYLMELRTKK